MMPTVQLTTNEWGQMMNILASTKEWPWTVTNPLLMKIGDQLRTQQPQQPEIAKPDHRDGDGKETHHG